MYVYKADSPDAPNDEWEIVVEYDHKNEKPIMFRYIDGAKCAVFKVNDSEYHAQTCASLGLNPEEWMVNVQF